MPRYTVTHRYFARRDGRVLGPWGPGDAVDLREHEADWVNRDSPGTLTLDAPPEPPAVETFAAAGVASASSTPVTDGPPVEEPPAGTAQVVLGWVGDDPDRAARALDAENAREQPRSTLVAALDRIARKPAEA